MNGETNGEKKINVSITSGTAIRAILLVVLLLTLYYIRDIVLVVLTAIVIASAIEPAVQWFKDKKFRRLPAVVIIYVALALILATLFIFFVPLVLNDTAVYLKNLPESVNLSDLWKPIQDFGLIASGNSNIPLADKSFSIKAFVDASSYALSGTSASAFKTISLVFGGAISFVLIIVLSFYLAVQEDGVANFLRIVSPVRHHEYIIGLWKRSQRKIGYWLQGQLLLGVIVGVLVYLGLMVLGANHALLLATIAAVFELIPIFGPILAAVPAVLIAVVQGGITKALLVAGLYLIVHQFENHLLYPLVVRKIVGVSPIVVIISLVIGAKLAGFLGALLAVPIAAAFMEYIEDIERDKKIVV